MAAGRKQKKGSFEGKTKARPRGGPKQGHVNPPDGYRWGPGRDDVTPGFIDDLNRPKPIISPNPGPGRGRPGPRPNPPPVGGPPNQPDGGWRTRPPGVAPGPGWPGWSPRPRPRPKPVGDGRNRPGPVPLPRPRPNPGNPGGKPIGGPDRPPVHPTPPTASGRQITPKGRVSAEKRKKPTSSSR